MRMMRWLMPLLGAGLVGCPPSADLGGFEGALVIELQGPNESRTVAEGTAIRIPFYTFKQWSASATYSLIVEHEGTGTTTALIDAAAVPDGRNDVDYEWDTSGFDSGDYTVTLELVAAGEVFREETAEGVITIDDVATFEFTTPLADVTVPAAGEITIGYRASDQEGTASADIILDADGQPASGDEITLRRVDIPETETTATFTFDGTDELSDPVPAGAYSLRAVVAEPGQGTRLVTTGVTVTVE